MVTLPVWPLKATEGTRKSSPASKDTEWESRYPGPGFVPTIRAGRRWDTKLREVNGPAYGHTA